MEEKPERQPASQPRPEAEPLESASNSQASTKIPSLLTEKEIQLLKTLKADWFLWEINAVHPVERKEFNQIVSYLKQKESLTIPTGKLLEMNIHPSRSSLLRKLAQSKAAEINRDKLTLHYGVIDKENLGAQTRQIENIFTEMMKKGREEYMSYPTSHFKIIDRECINTIPLEKIGWKNLNGKQYKGKLLEIIFPEKRYPPIMITANEFQYLQRVAINKIIFHMMKLAGEETEFFTQRIEVDKKRMSAQYPRLFDFDMMRLNKRSSRGYREEYTTIVLEKLFSNKNLTKMMLVEFDSDANSHIMKYFSPTNPASYDFLQSFDFLKEIYLNSDINNAVQTNTLNKMVFESIKLYLSLDEIHTAIYNDFPELAEHQFEAIIAKFMDEYVHKKNRHGIPQIFNFKMTTDEGVTEEIFVHYLNLNRLLNGALERLELKLTPQLVNDWEQRIANHRLTPAMFSNRYFAQKILKICSEEEPFLYKLMKKPSIYRILESLDQLSRLTLRLKLYTHNELDKVFNLQKEKIYQSAYDHVISDKSFFAKLVFKILNWFQKKSFDPNAVDFKQEKEETPVQEMGDGKTNKVSYLQAVKAESEEDLMQKCDNLWARLPDSLNHKEIDQNVRADLFGFFRQRKEVPVFALEYTVDTNVNRILKRGQHLISYKKELTEYIRSQVYLTIFKNSHLRRKVNLTTRPHSSAAEENSK